MVLQKGRISRDQIVPIFGNIALSEIEFNVASMSSPFFNSFLPQHLTVPFVGSLTIVLATN